MDFKAFAQLPSDKAEAIKNEIESRFFNISDGLDPSMIEILNAKIAQIRDYFVDQINVVTHNSDVLRQKVARLEELTKGGVKLEDLDAERLIEQLSLLEDDKRDQHQRLKKIDLSAKVLGQPSKNGAKVIWELLAKYFGPDYFLEAVQND